MKMLSDSLPIAVLLLCLATAVNGYDIDICEGRLGNIKCKAGTTIKATNANFGRTNSKSCTSGHAHLNGKCLHDVHCFVMKLCDGKNNCRLNATAGIYGDECPDMSKYIHVSYRCQDTKRTCEGKTMKLVCEGSGSIRIMHAFYARTDHSLNCQKHPGTKDLVFIADVISLAQISDCNKRNSCSIPVKDSVLNPKGWFSGVSKYLEVTYTCS